MTSKEFASAQAQISLSRSLRRLGRISEALIQARQATELEPRNALAQQQHGMCLFDTRQLESASECFRKAIALDPSLSTSHQGLGLTLHAMGRNSDAVRELRKAANLAPGSIQILGGLIQALMDESETSEAVASARRMLALRPNQVEAHLILARALAMDNKPLEAESHLKTALGAGPADANTSFTIGTIFQSLGRLVEAETHFRRSFELVPENGVAYSALVYNRKIGEADRALIDRMEGLCERDLIPVAKSHFHYALGKSLDDLRDYEKAMVHFDEANRLASEVKFGNCLFDQEHYASKVDDAISKSNRRSATANTGASESELPIFVIGMQRSGTTLVNQILSSHPRVGSVGEQGFWLHHRNRVLEEDGSTLRRLAEDYLAILARTAPGMRRVVDKMPDNYLEIPLLHAAFPKAKFIHCMRNPLDTCISIYTTMNRLRIDWAHNRANIVFAYLQYLRLMEQWRTILPVGTIMEVRYEDLVTNSEQVTREMVPFCGLDWDDACLHPEANRRTVSTPSSWQVRQPVYRSSIERWRNYEPWLGEFADLLHLV